MTREELLWVSILEKEEKGRGKREEETQSDIKPFFTYLKNISPMKVKICQLSFQRAGHGRHKSPKATSEEY